MRRALRYGYLALVLMAGVATPAVAAQPKPTTKKVPDTKAPPKDAKAPPTAKEPMSDGTAIAMLAVLGVLVVVGGGGFLAWKLVSGARGAGKGDGRPPEPILPVRQHDWELRMSDEQEAAMLRGIQAYRDGGHSLYLSHGDALITFYEPTMLVSLHRVTDAYVGALPQAPDPVALMRSVLDGFAASEGPGVLHTRKGWYAPPVDGLDHLAFTRLCHDTLTCPQPYIEGTQGSSSDENNGNMTVKIQVDGPLNTLCVDLGRVLPAVREARASRPGDPLIELVRPVLRAMAHGETPGAMWTRGAATPAEIDLVARIVATSAQRAA